MPSTYPGSMRKYFRFNFNFLFPKGSRKTVVVTVTRKELEEKAVQGAKKAVEEYRRVFERLAEYDRTQV